MIKLTRIINREHIPVRDIETFECVMFWDLKKIFYYRFPFRVKSRAILIYVGFE